MDSEQTDSTGDSQPPLTLTPDLSRFVENMGLHYENYGVPRIGGRILGLLLLAREPQAPEQIADILQVSRSSISTNLRLMLMAGLVEKVSLPGQRSDYYTVPPEAWERTLRGRVDSILELRELAEEGLAALDGQNGQHGPARENLHTMIAWADLIDEVYAEVLEKWRSRLNSTSTSQARSSA